MLHSSTTANTKGELQSQSLPRYTHGEPCKYVIVYYSDECVSVVFHQYLKAMIGRMQCKIKTPHMLPKRHYITKRKSPPWIVDLI